MSQHKYDVTPFAELIPDPGPEADHPNPGSVELGAGHLEVGFYVDGARVVLARRKAGGFLDDLARASSSATRSKSK